MFGCTIVCMIMCACVCDCVWLCACACACVLDAEGLCQGPGERDCGVYVCMYVEMLSLFFTPTFPSSQNTPCSILPQVFDSPVDIEGIPRGLATSMSSSPILQRAIQSSVELLLKTSPTNMAEYTASSNTFKVCMCVCVCVCVCLFLCRNSLSLSHTHTHTHTHFLPSSHPCTTVLFIIIKHTQHSTAQHCALLSHFSPPLIMPPPLQANILDVPSHFFYSTGDVVADINTIEGVIGKWQERGLPTTKTFWKDSKHVMVSFENILEYFSFAVPQNKMLLSLPQCLCLRLSLSLSLSLSVCLCLCLCLCLPVSVSVCLTYIHLPPFLPHKLISFIVFKPILPPPSTTAHDQLSVPIL